MRPGVEITPRKQWPTGLGKIGIELSGKINDGPAAGPGHRQADRPGLGRRGCASCWPNPTPRCPGRGGVAAIAVLKAWDWARRPTALLALDSASHPILIRSLAARLAEVGELDNLGYCTIRPNTGR